jgi:hypothetical protein
LLFQLNMCCPTVVICAFVYCGGSAGCLTLVTRRGGCCFSSFYDFVFVFLLCCLLCLLEYCLVAWLLGAVVLGRVVEQIELFALDGTISHYSNISIGI